MNVGCQLWQKDCRHCRRDLDHQKHRKEDAASNVSHLAAQIAPRLHHFFRPHSPATKWYSTKAPPRGRPHHSQTLLSTASPRNREWLKSTPVETENKDYRQQQTLANERNHRERQHQYGYIKGPNKQTERPPKKASNICWELPPHRASKNLHHFPKGSSRKWMLVPTSRDQTTRRRNRNRCCKGPKDQCNVSWA